MFVGLNMNPCIPNSMNCPSEVCRLEFINMFVIKMAQAEFAQKANSCVTPEEVESLFQEICKKYNIPDWG